jgi:hypothetical protein
MLLLYFFVVFFFEILGKIKSFFFVNYLLFFLKLYNFFMKLSTILLIKTTPYIYIT